MVGRKVRGPEPSSLSPKTLMKSRRRDQDRPGRAQEMPGDQCGCGDVYFVHTK